MEYTSFLMKAIAVTAFLTFLLFHKVRPSTYSNVALNKPSAQSSDLHDRTESNLANNGDLGQSLNLKQCTHTKEITNNWWIVDLLFDYDVHAIGLLNRDGSWIRLTDFYIYVSLTNPLPIPDTNNTFTGELCLHHPGTVSSNGIQTVSCTQPVKGRFVYLWKPANSVLTLCEFQVLVPDIKRESKCIISEGKRIDLPATYVEYVQPTSMFTCYFICMSEPGREAIHVQLDKRTGKCECIQDSPLIGPSPGISTHTDFDLCHPTDKLSFT